MILLAGLVLFSWEDGAMIKVIKADEKMRVLYKYKEKWESEDNI